MKKHSDAGCCWLDGAIADAVAAGSDVAGNVVTKAELIRSPAETWHSLSASIDGEPVSGK
jgi:hypothetical protein